MRVDHDTETGTVRLDAEACEALLAYASDPQTQAAPPSPVADLLATGAVDQALAAVRAPVLRVHVVVAGTEVAQTHDAWVTPEAAAFRLAVRDDEHQVTATPPALLPAALARVVRLGPRKVGDRTAFPVASDAPDAWFDADPGRRAQALDAVGARFAWSATAEGPDGSAGVTVVDGGDGAYVLTADGHDSTDDALLLDPVTPTRLWRWLTSVLPSEPEEPDVAAGRPQETADRQQ